MSNVLMRFVKGKLGRLRGEFTTKQLVKRGLKVGKNFDKTSLVTIDYGFCWLIEIGDNVTLAPRSIILAHDASTKMWLGKTKIGKVKIGNNVFVGANSVVLPNVTIGDNVVIGAGSVVASDIPSGVIAAGVPARPIMSSEDYITKMRNKMTDEMLFETKKLQYSKFNSEEDIQKITSVLKDKTGFVD